MKASIFAAFTVVALLGALPAGASLTTSETEQVRGYVATDAHADRVRALVARPDLSADESAGAMAAALGGVVVDSRRLTYLDEVIHGAPTAAERPVLAVATARGLLARVEALYAQHPADLDRTTGPLAEIALAYAWLDGEVAGSDASMTDAARSDIGSAIVDHVAKYAAILRPDVAVPLAIARLRAQLAIALYDAMPPVPTRRVDAADKLSLTGPRRAALVERGVLVLDATGSDDHVAGIRALLERMPPRVRDAVEAVFVGDEHAQFRARGYVVCAAGAPGSLGEASSPWSPDADAPDVPAATMSLARGLAEVAVQQALERRPSLRVQVEHDGGPPGVVAMASMLSIDAPRTVDVAAARLVAGRPESAAWLADALGALAVFAPSGAGADGLVLGTAGAPATHVMLEPTGTASAFRMSGHLWRIERGPAGAVTAFRHDGAPVALSMLSSARVAPADGSSWMGAGLVFARLGGAPRVAIAAGPRVRVLGTGGFYDAVTTPAPAESFTLDADLRVDGAPAGVAVRALPAVHGFEGASVLVIPGTPQHVAIMVGDGSGAETAASPVIEAPGQGPVHVHLVLAGDKLSATVGATTTSVALPGLLAHGDVALRAYAGAVLDVSGWALRPSHP